MADKKETIKRKPLFNPKFWNEIVKLAAERLEEKEQRRRQTRVRGRKTTERKFWSQPSFWAWVAMAILIAITVPKAIATLLTKVATMFFPLTISWEMLEVLFFLVFLGLWAWPKKHLKFRQIFLGWLVIAIGLAARKPAITIPAMSLSFFWIVSECLVLLGLGIWLKICFDVAGTPEIPHQVILARFGRAIDVISEGLFFKFVPFEKVKRVPTGQYSFNYSISKGLYTKEEKKLRSQPIEVDITVYLRFPRAERNYLFPERPRTATEEEMGWKEISGRELLMKHLYYRLPVPDLMAPDAGERMRNHFAGAVVSGIRHVLSTKNSQCCKEEIRVVEQELKTYLLQEQGNPFFECGLPKECLDIELLKIKLPDETEKAYIKPELARKDAEAASYDRISIRRRVEAFRQAGVSPDIAGVLGGGGIEGKGMTMDQLRDLSLYLSISRGVIGFQPIKPGGQSNQKK